MLKFSHIGIPTDAVHPDEKYIPQSKMYIKSYNDSLYKIEWLRFEPGCPMPELIKKIPHVAYEVDNISEAVKGKKILMAPHSPFPGVVVAFIEDDGAPVEFIQS
jgi:hypothetical protein